MSHITPVGDKLLNDPEDIDWLFSTHLRDFPEWRKKTKSFILSGNEDAPSAIILMAKKEPLVSDSGEAVFMPDFYSGDLVLKTKRGGIIETKRNPLAAHAAAIMGAPLRGHRSTRAAPVRRNPVKRGTSQKMPNRGYYIVQADMSYGGYEYGIDAVTPIPWRIWRTTRTLKGYTFQIPPIVYDKPGFKEWAEKNSGPGYPLFATLNQLRAMTKAFLKN